MLRSTLVQAGGNFNSSQNPVFHKESLTMLLNIKDACKLVTYQTCKLQKCQSLFFMRGARVGKWWQHSSPTNMARAWILALRPFVGWISCWFSPLLMRFFSEFPGFLLSLNTAKFQFDLEMHGHVSMSSLELLSAPWVNKLQNYKKKVQNRIYFVLCGVVKSIWLPTKIATFVLS